MITLSSYFVGAFALGWVFGALPKYFERMIEVSTS